MLKATKIMGKEAAKRVVKQYGMTKTKEKKKFYRALLFGPPMFDFNEGSVTDRIVKRALMPRTAIKRDIKNLAKRLLIKKKKP